MASLSTSFCGVLMSNPFVIAASPATESVEGILKCAEAGAGAVITKSIADYDESALPTGARRTYLDSRGLWATSTFRRETLSQKKGMELIDQAAQKTEVPIFASIAATELDANSWLPACRGAEEAGASLIQLDLFYLPQPICTLRSLESLPSLLDIIAREISVPVVPKLNIEIPAYLAAQLLSECKISGVSLLDSVRVPCPFDIARESQLRYRFIKKPGMSSLFGSWQLPLTQHYTMIWGRHTNLPLCAGGGLTDARDALELIMLGATAVQYATAILTKGYNYIRELVREMDFLVEQLGCGSIRDLQGLLLKEFRTDSEGAEPTFEAAKATIDRTSCIMCKRCLDLAFCDAIVDRNDFVEILHSRCDGCGLCTHFCDVHALTLAGIE